MTIGQDIIVRDAVPMNHRSDLGHGFRDAGTRFVVVPVESDAMEPTISQGEAVVCDTAIDRYVADALYVVSHCGIPKVRRLAASTAGLRLLCDNPLYSSETVAEDQSDQVPILGKVVCHLRRM